MHLYTIKNGELVKLSIGNQDHSPFDSVIDEYNSWMEYRKLHTETGDNKYAVAAHEEFRHVLLWLSTALENVESQATSDAEKAELNNFLSALKA